MVGAVAGGVDVGIRRPAMIVDQDAVFARDAGVGRDLGVRDDADADDHQIGRNALAGFGEHRFDMPVRSGKP